METTRAQDGAPAPGGLPPLSAWLSQAAARHPDRPALVDVAGGVRLAYAALSARVTAAAEALRRAGLGGGDRLGIAASRDPDTLVWMLAALEAGLAYVPFDLDYPATRLAAMAEDAAPRAFVGPPAALEALAGLLGPLPGLASPAESAPRHAAAADLAYVLFTSGSTGRPKGVAMGKGPLSHLIAWQAADGRLGQPARTLLFAPFSFDVHFQELLGAIATGGCLVLVPDAVRRDPEALLRLIEAEGVERLYLPYVALQLLAEAAGGRRLPLRDVISAGEQLVLSPAIRRLFEANPQARLHNHYGPTESHVVTALCLPEAVSAWPAVAPIGQPLPHVRVHLDPAEEGHELLLGGECLAHGYLGRPELEAGRFIEHPALGRAYRTGDRVAIEADGALRYEGRGDQQLKIDGFRIEPGEVEAALLGCPGVREAAVGAIEQDGLRSLAAWVVREPGGPPVASLRAALAERLPAAWVPLHLFELPALPKTPSGKLDRKALKAPAGAEEAPGVADTGTPETPRELLLRLWREALGQPALGEHDSVFEAGARSLLVLRVLARLREAGLEGLGVAQIYDHPTVAGQCAVLARQAAAEAPQGARRIARTDEPIAVIGMALRAPGCPDVEAFWQALLAGHEGLRRFAPGELDPAVPADWRQRPNFVPVRGVLERAEHFDAAFFGLPQREAVLLDPQQRQLLELAWQALEDAGIDPRRQPDIGIWAGTANNGYAALLRREAGQLVEQAGEFALMLASEKDYAATRIAHRLDLRGPAVSVHTACSTGLVAIGEAVEALRAGRCAVALAGGATVLVPQAGGYLHVEGGMESGDGHCRPFDAAASGTVFSSAAAMVVLKPLSAALADGDTVHAVVRGVGINNDGGDKASFTAPSARGQAEALRRAVADAGIDPASLGFIEAHGTGTALGDPIEVEALRTVYGGSSDDPPLLMGSLKSNFGHTIAAAGVLGFLKAVLAVREGQVPGTLHFRQPNPALPLAGSRLRVAAEALPWPAIPGPRRAAVSSFGVGGTNAHVIVEQAPPCPPVKSSVEPDGAAPAPRLLPLSAATPEGLKARAAQLAGWLEAHPEAGLAAVQATLVRGRVALPQRACVLAESAAQAASALRALGSGLRALPRPRVVWLLPGQGSQHPGMAAALHAASPIVRETLDEGLASLPADETAELRELLLDPTAPEGAARLADTALAQPALLLFEVAMGRWLAAQGVRVDALIGHSIGEFSAACLAGALDLRDALRCVQVRARAMAAQPRGAMAAVRAAAETVEPRLPPGLEIAALNAPALCVVAGPEAALEAWLAGAAAEGLEATRLKVSHAFHSAAMEPAMAPLREAMAGARFRPAGATLYACASGRPHDASSLRDPDYWARQLRLPVRFAEAVRHAAGEGDAVFVELGPGQALSALLRQMRDAREAPLRVVPLLPAAGRETPAWPHALEALGKLWSHGVDLDWAIPADTPRARLPVYPFDGPACHFPRAAASAGAAPAASPAVPRPIAATAPAVAPATTTALPPPPAPPPPMTPPAMTDRLPALVLRLRELLAGIAGLEAAEIALATPLVEQDFDSLTLTQAALEIERVFGEKLRFRRLMEDLDTVEALARHLDAQLPAEAFRPAAAPPPAAAPVASGTGPAMALPATPTMAVPGELIGLMQQQLALMQQTLALVGQGALPPAAAPALAAPAAAAPAPTAALAPAASPVATVAPEAARPEPPATPDLKAQPFGASARISLRAQEPLGESQARWLADFTRRYLARTGRSREFSQKHRARMADPRVVTGFNPQWKDLVYPIVAERSRGATITDLDGNTYIDLLSCFGANLLGYQPPALVEAMHAQLDCGIEVGPQHPLAAEVAERIADFTGHERVAFCNTGSEAVMGAMRIARTVTGRKTIAIFTNSYHGIFDEVIVRGTRQLRSLAAAPGILASAVENVLVLDYASEESLRVLRERAHELAAIMIEPVQNKLPTLQPHAFVRALREIADAGGCALIFDEVVTGFRLGTGGAQAFYGVRADLCTYGKIIGGGLPLAAIAGRAAWMDALDGGFWRYGDESYPEAGVTYFAGTFVRHPLALAAAKATLEHLGREGPALYARLDGRTQRLVDRLNQGFAERNAPVRAVHCASLWRLHWDEGLRFVSLFYYLARFHGLHLYEQFGHFVTDAMDEAVIERIGDVFLACLDELMAEGFIPRRDGATVERPPALPATRSMPIAEASPAGGEWAPLSPGQAERWMAANFDAGAARALNETFCLALDGPLDLPALQAAFADVAGHHPAFRLAFDREQPRQRVLPTAAVPALPMQDLAGMPDPEARLGECLRAGAAQTAPLDTAGHVAATLYRLGAERHVLHVRASHLVFDGWASPVFLDDLARAYAARREGRVPVLPPAGHPGTLAQSLAEAFAGEAGRAAREHWARALASPPAPLMLGDLQPVRRHFGAGTHARLFPPAVLEALRGRARQAKCSLFQWLFAELATLLASETGREDFVLCLPYAGQNAVGAPRVIGDAVLDLPVRVRTGGALEPAALLARCRPALLDALEHPLMTQGLAARLVGRESLGDRPPFGGVYFNLNPRLPALDFPGLAARFAEGEKPGLLGEVMFNFYELPEGLRLDLHYSTDFFSAGRIEALVAALARRLGDASAPHAASAGTPATVVANAPVAAKAPAVDAAAGATARALLDAPRREAGARTALRFAGQGRDYATLDARIRAIGAALHAAGVRPGGRVGVSVRRGFDLPAALLGVWEAGAAYVPLDPALPPGRLAHMVEDAGITVILADGADTVPERLRAGRQVLALDRIGEAPSGWQRPALTPAHPAYVLYTSGSTGKPKGVEVGQGNVAAFLEAMRQRPGITSDDRLLAVTTPAFDISVLELFLPLSVGACVVLASEDEARNPDRFWPLFERERPSLLQATPSVLAMWLGDAPAERFRDTTLLLGGEGLPLALARRLAPACKALWNMYGPTETTVWSSCWRVPHAPERISVGEAIAGTTLRVLDAALMPVPPGEEGEIVIAGAGVAQGYLNLPALTEERFVRLPDGERAYRTGDRGRWLPEGTLEHLGRMDAQVKLRGYRIELGEIEAVLEQAPGVLQAVVSVREDRPGDQRLVAHLRVDGARFDADEALARCRDELPEYMLPQHLVPMAAFPLLPSGKVDRKALPAPEQPATAPGRAPADAAEATVCRIMAELLGIEAVDPEASFFQLGGHSLLAIQLATRLNREGGGDLTMREVFELRTAAALAKRLGGASPDAAPARHLPVQAEQGKGPLSAMQARLVQILELNPASNSYNMPSAHRLRGPLDVARLERALAAFIDRHPALRTTLCREKGEWVQQVAPPGGWRLPPLEDVSALPDEATRLARVDERLAELVRRPVPLDRAPMASIALFRLAADDHILFVMPHHAIWDGWSFDILYRDLARDYAAPPEEPVTPTACSYLDFAHWHAGFLGSPEYARQREAARQRLRGAGPWRALTGDRPRTGRMGGASQDRLVSLPMAQVARLEQRARETDATLFHLLLAGTAAAIERSLGLQRLLLGTPMRGRNLPELEDVVGYFVNLVPIALGVRPEQPLSALVAQARDATQEALASADVLLEDLVDLLRVDAGAQAGPMYQAVFSFQDVRGRPTAWGELEHSRYYPASQGVTEDIALNMVLTPTGLHLLANYNPALFGAAEIESLLERLKTVLDRLAEDPAQPLSAIEGMAAAPAAATPPALPPATPPPAPAVPDAGSTATDDADLLALCAAMLGLSSVRPEDNFFALGGHSLLALQFVQRVQAATGIRLPLVMVAQQSLGALQAQVDGQRRDSGKDGHAAGGEPRQAAAGGMRGWLRRLLRGSA